jgi:hypothetical protein
VHGGGLYRLGCPSTTGKRPNLPRPGVCRASAPSTLLPALIFRDAYTGVGLARPNAAASASDTVTLGNCYAPNGIEPAHDHAERNLSMPRPAISTPKKRARLRELRASGLGLRPAAEAIGVARSLALRQGWVGRGVPAEGSHSGASTRACAGDRASSPCGRRVRHAPACRRVASAGGAVASFVPVVPGMFSEPPYIVALRALVSHGVPASSKAAQIENYRNDEGRIAAMSIEDEPRSRTGCEQANRIHCLGRAADQRRQSHPHSLCIGPEDRDAS